MLRRMQRTLKGKSREVEESAIMRKATGSGAKNLEQRAASGKGKTLDERRAL